MAFIHLPDLEEREIIPGFHARMQHTEHMTIAFWKVEAGASLPEHGHPHEQITAVISGTFEMTVNGEKRIIGPGDVVVIPSQATHSATALTECRLVDVFSPAREDYR